MKLHRLGLIGATIACAVALSSCGGQSYPTSQPSGGGAPSSAALPPVPPMQSTDTFGPGCAQLPQGTAAGSLTSMNGQPVATAASANPLLSSFADATRKANLVDTLNQKTGITVLAPSNDAFAAWQNSAGQGTAADPEALGALLRGHVLPLRYNRAELVAAATDGGLDTLQGASLTVKDAGDTVEITDGSGQTAKVICGNVQTTNATVFVIDKVLMVKNVS